MGILDDEYGEPAGDGDLDPTHLRALAQRIKVLAEALEAIRRGGENRDMVLGGIKGEVSEVKLKVAAIEREVDEILRNGKQFTEEQVKTLEGIILGRTFREKFWTGFRRYAGYAAAVGIFVYTTRDWLREAILWILHK